MIRKRYLSEIVTYKASVGMWMGVALVSIITNTMMSGWLFLKNPREQVTVIPPEINRPFKVVGGQYSSSYVEQMSTWFLSQMLTFTPSTIDYQQQLFMKYVTPKSWGKIGATLTKDKEYITREQITSAFFIKKFKAQGMTAYVEGLIERRVGRHTLDPKVAHWMIKLVSLPNGRIAIDDIQELKDEKEFITYVNTHS